MRTVDSMEAVMIVSLCVVFLLIIYQPNPVEYCNQVCGEAGYEAVGFTKENTSQEIECNCQKPQ